LRLEIGFYFTYSVCFAQFKQIILPDGTNPSASLILERQISRGGIDRQL